MLDIKLFTNSIELYIFEGTINIEKLAQGTYLVKVNDIDKGYTIIKN
jgi:hypothetical protein